MLAVAVTCVLARAKNFREIGDQAADPPQDLLAALGGRPHPLWRRIIAPSEKRIRTLIQALDAAALDVAIGGWLRALAAAGQVNGLLILNAFTVAGADNLCHLARCSAGHWLPGPRGLPGRGMIFGLWG